jgi:hypothetical protein
VGGILGLFAGFSTLSFVELIYWFTVRVALVKCSRASAKIFPTSNHSDWKLLKLKEFVTGYFDESSIHGLNHILEISRIGRYHHTIMKYSKFLNKFGF